MSNENLIVTELLKYSPDTLIELFVLDLSPLASYYASVGAPIATQQYYFYNGTNLDFSGESTNLVWQGNTYAKLPIKLDTYSVSSGGELPKPTIEIADNSNPRVILPLLRAYEDLTGAKIIRKRTFLKFIDAVNFSGNVAPSGYTPDPTAAFPDETFLIDRKSSEIKTTVTFELAVPWDVQGVLLPKRLVLANLCPWEYRGGLGKGRVYRSSDAADANFIDTWSEATNLITNKLHCVAANGSTVVAVGSRGAVVRSTNDGTSWGAVTSFTDYTLNAVAYTLSMFIAVGNNGIIYTSATGASGTWTARTSGVGTDLHAVSSGGTYAVAVGDDNTLVYSTDGITWTAGTTGLASNIDLRFAVYNGTKYVVGGKGGRIAYTTAGLPSAWTAIASTAQIVNVDLTDAAVNGSKIMVTGGKGTTITSTNGSTWTLGPVIPIGNATVRSITYTTGNIFVVCGGTTILKSIDESTGIANNGTNFERVTPIKFTALEDLAYTGTTLVAIGGTDVLATDAPSGCTYDGNKYFNVNDEAVGAPALDVCGKRLGSCIARFGKDTVLPFGGFPSAGLLR